MRSLKKSAFTRQQEDNRKKTTHATNKNKTVERQRRQPNNQNRNEMNVWAIIEWNRNKSKSCVVFSLSFFCAASYIVTLLWTRIVIASSITIVFLLLSFYLNIRFLLLISCAHIHSFGERERTTCCCWNCALRFDASENWLALFYLFQTNETKINYIH